MQFNTLFFLLIGSYLCLALAQVSYDDCCLRYVKTLSSRTQRHAVKYRWQVPDGGCNLPAIIFTMKKGREFCTDPRERWVGDLMKIVNEKEIKKSNKRPTRRRPSHRLRG
ncbi:C-C motif chemokine 20 [Notolabrus celidotus]|uniref:C-C motif chemokine 20 n=1 Tax=Notolabrus celidotus TaxID=1203425 RepID=UPI00148F983A|nr:C-C motif chemokine 20 [Notolabrus celidotus]